MGEKSANSTYSDAEHDKLKTAGLLSGPDICVNLVLNPRGKLLAFEELNSAIFYEKNIKLAVMITLTSLASGYNKKIFKIYSLVCVEMQCSNVCTHTISSLNTPLSDMDFNTT